MRFHSLLLSLVNHVPFVAVAYDTKCWRFVQEVKYPYALELEKLNIKTLLEHYEHAVKAAATTKKQLAGISDQLFEEAKETAWNP
jgi:polysaccharide pyruvyl transferase WcaK-like protein